MSNRNNITFYNNKINTNYIIENEKLTLQYIPGNGAWTYQLIIPNTKDIKGKWGDLKVSGTIDGFEIKNKNLGPIKNSDKKMAINSEIRNAINKTGGDTVTVTLFLENQNNKTDYSEILECFRDAQVLPIFKKLQKKEQQELLNDISNVATIDQKAEKIVSSIEKLESKR